ncbi:MAG TPA: hypothetical protein VN843_03940 [Anaerolineales bacterium]|nr:hypothetical protein [Anaerolineales bacterium]
MPNQGSAGYVPDFEPMVTAYYKARLGFGYGQAFAGKLMELGLEDIAKDLWG